MSVTAQKYFVAVLSLLLLGALVVAGTVEARRRVAADKAGQTQASGPLDPQLDRGRQVYEKYSCIACHGPGGGGGVHNVNAQTGGMINGVRFVAETYTKQDLAKKILDGWLDFDVAIAHPSMMRHVGKLGRVLGPHGKMPSPKSGTVTDDIARVSREFIAGKIEFRNDDTGNLHVVMGKKSFPPEKLAANIHAFLDHVRTLKPPSSKGVFLQKVVLSSTMSPGVPVAVS